MTYAEWYVAGMYELLEGGGRQEVIDALIGQINNPTNEGLEKYLEGREKIRCDSCGEPYDAEGKKPHLDEEMLCSRCKTQKESPP